MIVLRSPSEIEAMRRAGDLVARAFALLDPHVRAGTRLDELDRLVAELLRSEGAGAPYKGYRPSPSVPPFPGTVCASVNEQVVHGIPGPRKLREGDIVGIDIGATLGGWVGDACYTYAVGGVPPRARRLLDVTRESLEAGIAEVGPGKRLGDAGAAIQEVAEGAGYGVVRELGGHGVGRNLHEDPHVNHFGKRGHGMRLREGMTFTLEPMVNEGTPEIELLRDGWTVVTGDGKLSAQYEHTIAVTKTGCEILTPWHLRMDETAEPVAPSASRTPVAEVQPPERSVSSAAA
ncbi:type I methionyl aminopeptidase [Rubrobacter marinus]|nr:type I methionyl aminopeptidase [Rubrobacter marinus]